MVLVTYFGLTSTSKWLASFKIFAPHPAFPPDLSPEGVSNLKQGELFGMTLEGKWWIGIIQHGLINLGLFVHVLRGVIG